jgi:pimeloyl-ACP methyl ester carboxylesterase
MSTIARNEISTFHESWPVVIALHCSGGSPRQWRNLADALGPRFEVITPNFYGSGSGRHWSGERPFSLNDEARQVIDIIDRCDGPVHIVGHSYGGGVALRVAVARSAQIASLSLYEPTAFHVLKCMGPDGLAHLAEIRAVAANVQHATLVGDYHFGARHFVDYWNGRGAWDTLRAEARSDLARHVPKACLDFHALIEEKTPLAAYRRIRGQLLLLRGEHAPEPIQAIIRKLTTVMKPGSVMTIAGAGHMGPFSHAERVADAIAAHIAASEHRVANSIGNRSAMRAAA